jgi:hypothetical protein
MVVAFLRRTHEISIPDDRPGADALPCAKSLDQPVGTDNAGEPAADGRDQKEW